MAFKLIVAVDSKRGIGKENKIPWRLKADILWFKDQTLAKAQQPQNTVIMGRKTWDSLPEKFKPLPLRHNIVITRSPGQCQAPHVVSHFEAALQMAYSLGGDVFVIGGSSIYEQALQHPDLSELLITEIQHNFQCDTFFPDYGSFHKRDIITSGTENGLDFTIVRYQR